MGPSEVLPFTEARLANLYDRVNLHEADRPFYLALVRELAPREVVDLGCGTGSLALLLAAEGYRVTGIDPSPQMLSVARAKENPDAVRWVDGGADQLGEAEADLVLMTGHVAQFFVRDDEWRNALRRIQRALRVGGRLAFETRNPASEPWRIWTPETSHAVTELPDGQLETWYDVESVRDRVVNCAFYWRFPSGEQIREPGPLIFRDHDSVVKDLTAAGLEVEAAYGDWDRCPVSADSAELIYVARRTR